MNDHTFSEMLMKPRRKNSSSIPLDHGSRVAVMGGGPAGSFFSYILLDMAERVGLKVHVDIYEPKDFSATGLAGCNMCGGVIYESLVQSLAVEGINLPTCVVQRGIEHNMLHMDIGSVHIQTPRHEKRIATTFRSAGPRGLTKLESGGLDGYLLQAVIAKGARHIRSRIREVGWFIPADGSEHGNRLVQVKTQGAAFQTCKLLAVTSGVNTAALKLFHNLDFGYQPPRTTKLLVREYQLGEEVVSRFVGPVFHAFLLDIPGLDYSAINPKGKYVTVCLLSSHGDLEAGVMETFLHHPTVKRALPPDFSTANYACYCGPCINVMGCEQPFGDRIVFIGDSGVSRLYKDGIRAAYRAAKIVAATAVFQGVSGSDFKRYYLPFCWKMEFDNQIGNFLFRAISQVQMMQFARWAVLRMVSNEQEGKPDAERGVSMVMWDMLTGGVYVIQDGFVEVLIESRGQQIQLNILGKDEFFGEMAIFEHEIRSTTVRTLGPARILTVDYKNFLRRIHEDPSLAYRLMEIMSQCVRKLSEEVAQLKHVPS